MNNTIQGILWGFMAVMALTGLYEAQRVWAARRDTPALVARHLAPDQVSLKGSDLSPWQLEALLKVEDPSFFTHHGIDLKTPGQGLTTLPQGVAKRLYFHPFRSGFRKIELMLVTRFALDPMVSKQDQLTLFLNRIYLGRIQDEPIIGFQAASEGYFRRPFKSLTGDQYLSLVAMVIAPNTFHVLDHPEANAERVRRIRKLLSGEYRPKSLMDQYYGPLDAETRRDLPMASYDARLYQETP